MRAAIMTGPGTLTLADDVEVEAPQPGEVLVRVHWCSVCHSDLHVLDGVTPPPRPAILGHEAAGIVAQTGPGVTGLAVGDHVVLSMIGPCGRCAACLADAPVACLHAGGRGGVAADGRTRITWHGEMIQRALRVGGFAEQTVVRQEAAVKLPKELPLDLASLLGCSVQTGYGAVAHIAGVKAGDTVAVIGLGAVGIAAVQAARICGAATVIGVDPLASRRELAVRLGATAAVAPEDATTDAARDMAGGRLASAVIDTVTRPATVRQAVSLLAPRGIAVVIGVTPPGQELGIAAADIVLSQKMIAGCYLGNCVPTRDIADLIQLWQRGRLDLESMVTGRRPLEELGQAFDDLRAGTGLRTAVSLSTGLAPAPAVKRGY